MTGSAARDPTAACIMYTIQGCGKQQQQQWYINDASQCKVSIL